MKHSAKFFASAMLLTATLFTNAYAQEATSIAAVQSSYTLNTLNAEENTSTKVDPVANAAVSAKFATLFPTATEQKWSTSADNCWVSFLNNGRKAKASFTKEGKLNYIISDCAMEHLPGAFSKTISNKYASYRLFNAIEIKAHETVAYQAVLEDSKGFITLKYTSEGVEELQQVKKQ